MLALALVAAVFAFAAARAPKKGKAAKKVNPFTNSQCVEIDHEKLEALFTGPLRTAWEKMLADGEAQAIINGADSPHWAAVEIADALLKQSVPSGCYDADTAAYTVLFRGVWCGVLAELVGAELLGMDIDYIGTLCVADIDPREEGTEGWVDPYVDGDDDDAGEDPFPFADWDCSQLVETAGLTVWAQDVLYPAYAHLVEQDDPAPGDYYDHEALLTLTDLALAMSLPNECYDVDTDAYSALFAWTYCILGEDLATHGLVEEEPEDMVAFCDARDEGWDPREMPPTSDHSVDLSEGKTNPGGRALRESRVRLNGPGAGLRVSRVALPNPGGMMARGVSVSDVLITGQRMDGHCPDTTRHPCLDDTYLRDNPCGTGSCRAA